MATTELTSLDAIILRVRGIASEQLGLRLDQVLPNSRIIEDLKCDSLDLVELMIEIEDEFAITMPDESDDPIYKAVFTRQPFRIRDFGEIVLHQQQVRRLATPIEWLTGHSPVHAHGVPFTQCASLSDLDDSMPLLAPTGEDAQGHATFRRRTDGMRCVLIPGATVEIGAEGNLSDERPAHAVEVSPFIIDCEPVSTIAYCRFLNSIGERDEKTLQRWFLPCEDDHRFAHVPIERVDDQWTPRTAEAASWPMIMVSWHGASAYSRWANRLDWRHDKSLHRFAEGRTTMPTEAQWEYAARGEHRREFPWGSGDPTPTLAQFGMHRRGKSYLLAELPLSPVNAALGVSPFGLFHMAGNVWQWCADAYSPGFYGTQPSRNRDPLNDHPTGIRSERGGSWIGSGALLRSSYRRGREPNARGRCLGFRCTSDPATAISNG